MRFGPEDMTPLAGNELAKPHKPLQIPAQLQINQSGAWRGALDFDAGEVPPEFLQAADQLARLSGERTTMRVVYSQRRDNGTNVPTRNALMTWSREKGWVKA